MEQMHLTETHSITFLCDVKIHEALVKAANENFEGNISFQLRKILKEWSDKNEH